MVTIESKQIEVHTIILEQGIDYSPDDLEPDMFVNGLLSHLPAKKLTEIAQQKGFDKWSWTGHAGYQEESDTTGIKVKFAKYF